MLKILQDFRGERFFQGRYWVKGYMIDGNGMAAVLPDGNWKAEGTFYVKGKAFRIDLYFKSISSKFGLIR